MYVVAVTDIVNLISSLQFEEQRQMLAAISHQLTVVAREYAYKLGTQDPDSNIQRLRSLNEMQHQISGSLMKAAGEYPVTDVIRNLRGKVEADGLVKQLEWVESRIAEHLIKRFGRSEPPSSA